MHSSLVFTDCVEAISTTIFPFAGPPDINLFPLLTEEQAQHAATEGIPEPMVTYGQTLNGLILNWKAHNNPGLYGYINLLPLYQIYGDNLEDVLYFGYEGEDLRMPDYRLVDAYSNETNIGLLHDKYRSTELFYYDVAELFPTGVDLAGYCQLLSYSLGIDHWQNLLIQLASPEGQARPSRFLSGFFGNGGEDFINYIQSLLSDFTLDAFVARYDEVKLPMEKTWAVMANR